MIRFFFYLLILMIVFLIGMVIGLDGDHEQNYTNDEVEQIYLDSFDDDPQEDVIEQSMSLVENDRLLTKLASLCEAVVLSFYQLIVNVLHYITKRFI